MPIKLTGYNINSLCWGNFWEIEDEELLIELVAKVLIGHQHHVSKILRGVGFVNSINSSAKAKNDAIAKLTIPLGADSYHRDGLIFQIFSWIVAHKFSGNNSLIALPHLIPAQKGFDGLQVKIDTLSGEVEAVIIFEDKATENPRKTIRSMVWPEFRTFEEGNRESELMQETIGLISQRPDLIPDVDDAINKLVWNKVRFYRVAITGGSSHTTEKGLKSLFKGYENAVVCPTNIKRQGEVIYLPLLRDWINTFSQKVIVYLNSRVP